MSKFAMILVPSTVNSKGNLTAKVKDPKSTKSVNVRLKPIEIRQYLEKQLKTQWVEAHGEQAVTFDGLMEWTAEAKPTLSLEGLELVQSMRIQRDENNNPVVDETGVPVLIPQEVINPETNAVVGQWHTLVAAEE
tara:strand:- start:3897 stop:4301 length:405 start_codon:yes stop_codon:yes gene_type:complete